MKVDLHVHTKYSSCSNLKLSILRKLCNKFNIVPAITDHDLIIGAKRFNNCIVGEEMTTNEGHLIGLFLNERIKRGLSIEETVDKIKEQGGLVYVPHPFDGRRINVPRLNFNFDILEVFNGRVIDQKYNKKARDYANRHNLTKSVGSDSHTKFEFGRTFVEMERFDSPKEFLKNLKKAKFHIKKRDLITHFRINAISGVRKYILNPFGLR